MITTFQALVVALLTLLPGASYSLTYERNAGSYTGGSPDRLVRLFAASSIFLAVYSGPALLLYRHFVVSGDLRRGLVNWLMFEAVSVGYVLVPAAIGAAMGLATNRDWPIARWLYGRAPHPRAWDHVWSRENRYIVRIKLKSGTWLAGRYGGTDDDMSYASGYPEAGELYLSTQLAVHPKTGEFVVRDGTAPVQLPSGVLVRWEEIEYLDLQRMDEPDEQLAESPGGQPVPEKGWTSWRPHRHPIAAGPAGSGAGRGAGTAPGNSAPPGNSGDGTETTIEKH
ncbi:DUF6338 family protein [Nocardia sp. alder85J]|uniref:DUF6338 family protein n=1 Tax=Nocardia sp. alder85J TaxID=2862949 RepID=UPI001CD67166|nr:DUF6338 family protein [Nocardia sp. alder85J]MCX4092545.1 DUF6338 family protein [Nocardia sp. alder85J]